MDPLIKGRNDKGSGTVELHGRWCSMLVTTACDTKAGKHVKI
jgi:hypothetical protein